MARRLFALVLALLLAGAGVSSCTAAAIARAADAAPVQDPHAAHAHSELAGHADRAQSASSTHVTGPSPAEASPGPMSRARLPRVFPWRGLAARA